MPYEEARKASEEAPADTPLGVSFVNGALCRGPKRPGSRLRKLESDFRGFNVRFC